LSDLPGIIVVKYIEGIKPLNFTSVSFLPEFVTKKSGTGDGSSFHGAK